MRIKAIVGYDGTGYGGFQRQNNAPTIQAEIEDVLVQLTGAPTRVLAAGRTDAGVHAEGQVIAFDTEWRHPITELQRGMNALLPEQVVINELDVVDAGFHPRYDAKSRYYQYTIHRASVRHPFYARYSLHVEQVLDVQAMSQATQYLLGCHDFLAFGSPPQGDLSVREVFRAEWMAEEPWLRFDIEANAFLYRMVRMLVGTLLRVGSGALTPESFAEILETRSRERAGPAAVAEGLCLKSVAYASGREKVRA